MRNGREGGNRLESAGIPQMRDEGSVPAHGVAHDRLTIRVDVVKRLQHLGQFVHHVVVHPVVLGPRFDRGVDVESGAAAKVVGLVVRHIRSARARVRKDDANALLGGRACEMRLRARVLVGTREAGQVEEDRGRTRRATLQLRQENAGGINCAN